MTAHNLVMISLEGRCICPVHGVLGPDVEYQVGRAECGCTWEAGPGLILRSKMPLPDPQITCPMLQIIRNKTLKTPYYVAF